MAENGNWRPDQQPWVSPIENVNQNRTGNSPFSSTSLSCKRNSVHNTSVCTGQGHNNSASKKNQGGQERNNSSSSKKKKNCKLNPAKDYCNNTVQRSVNGPFANGGQEYNNSFSSNLSVVNVSAFTTLLFAPAKDVIQRRTKEGKSVIICHHQRRRIANWIQPKITATTLFRDLSTVLLPVEAKKVIIRQRTKITNGKFLIVNLSEILQKTMCWGILDSIIVNQLL